ncbi:MAG: hypothetical protein WAV70_18380, partial [Anaerolineae bacterium]
MRLRHLTLTLALLVGISLIALLAIGVAASAPPTLPAAQILLVQSAQPALDPADGSVLLTRSPAPPSALRPGELETMHWEVLGYG